MYSEQGSSHFERSFSFREKGRSQARNLARQPARGFIDDAKAQDKVVKTLTGGVRQLMKTNKVMVLEGMGTVTAPGKVLVKSSSGETQEIETKNIVIATGSVPIELPFAKFRRQNHRQQHRGTLLRGSAEKVSRRRRGRDRA
jgi:pyruvate/2-oxoglutarate dehydrogenase complex dihydrolipoamide dehydrogenase (E3) component